MTDTKKMLLDSIKMERDILENLTGEMDENGEFRTEDGTPTTINEWLSDALDIDLTVSVTNDGLRYRGCVVTTSVGGPNIYVDTLERLVKGVWGGDNVSVPLSYEVCDQIDDNVQEIFASPYNINW